MLIWVVVMVEGTSAAITYATSENELQPWMLNARTRKRNVLPLYEPSVARPTVYVLVVEYGLSPIRVTHESSLPVPWSHYKFCERMVLPPFSVIVNTRLLAL